MKNVRIREGRLLFFSPEERHEKTDLKVSVVAIPKEGLAGEGLPILLLV